MIYRIRYRAPSQHRLGEVSIEANSPNEALVKFRHLCDQGPRFRSNQEEVFSVSTDPLAEEPVG